ncbi:unnamed protein product, partial [Prorocentrum cordatum]
GSGPDVWGPRVEKSGATGCLGSLEHEGTDKDTARRPRSHVKPKGTAVQEPETQHGAAVCLLSEQDARVLFFGSALLTVDSGRLRIGICSSVVESGREALRRTAAVSIGPPPTFTLLVGAPPFHTETARAYLAGAWGSEWKRAADMAGASTVVRSLMEETAAAQARVPQQRADGAGAPVAGASRLRAGVGREVRAVEVDLQPAR